jgi:hypothetical protein
VLSNPSLVREHIPTFTHWCPNYLVFCFRSLLGRTTGGVTSSVRSRIVGKMVVVLSLGVFGEVLSIDTTGESGESGMLFAVEFRSSSKFCG